MSPLADLDMHDQFGKPQLNGMRYSKNKLSYRMYRISSNNSWGNYFYFCTKRAQLFEGGNYFKYFSQQVVPEILFYYTIKK